MFPDFSEEEVCECLAAEVMPMIFRVMACGSVDDLHRLVELDVLNADIFISATGVTQQFATECWREALSYRSPKSVKQALQRPDGEGEQWLEAVQSEIDFFFENGHITVCHKDDTLERAEIPPMSWLKHELPSLLWSDTSRMEYITDKALDRLKNGGTIDECIDVLSRKMQALTAKDGSPTGSLIFKKVRARACIKGCNQVRLQSFDPLTISAPVCHVAIKHLVNKHRHCELSYLYFQN
jgi:hypothetical protein